MKKILSIIFLLSFSLALSAQWYGNGLTAGSAYYGVINAASPMPTWNTARGTVYVGRSTAGQNDLEVASGGTLTIEQGITVKFCTTSSDLRITGTGILNASGSSSNLITFTKDLQAKWGHISFEASTGASIINYCIIENGLKTGAGIEGFGGGIHANTSNLVVSNSIVRNNYATYGGGIFVNKTQNPSISNCIINNNIASLGGGGLYFWNTSSSVITNCLIYNNSVTSTTLYGGGGILFGPSTGSVKVINCTLANNTAGFKANEVYFYSSPNARVINSILWGSNLPYYGATSSSFVNCAIQGGFPAGSVGCINLNSLNSDVTGPNFTTLDGSDWSIAFISPCRDAGTTPSPTAPTDYLGNPRIGAYDIGAYEVQYSKWTGATSTDWGTPSNWIASVDPSSGSGDVIIPSVLTNYPTSSAPDFTIGPGKTMILNPGAQATLGNLTNSGTLKLESDATNISSLITSGYSGNPASVDLYLTGGGSVGSYKWHYISIPFTTDVPVTIFTPVTLDIAGYNEPRVSTEVSEGWIGYDGWIYSTPAVDYDPTYAFSNLVPGRGYEFWDNNNNTFTISGTLNSSDMSPAVTFKTGGILNVNGYNLIGNPFPSGLNWDYITSHNYPAATSKTLYFTLNNNVATYMNGVGVPTGVNGFIAPMQGFMVKNNAGTSNIPLVAAARTHAMHSRYKGASIIPLVRLNLLENTISDETVVRFDELAKSGLDYDFDAVKMSVSTANLQIYSVGSVTNYVINGQPFPDPEVLIPIVINLKADGVHTINATELQGLDSYGVYLIDNTTGFTANLKTTPVLTFNASAGLIADRFILKVTNVITAIEDPKVSNYKFNIYQGSGMINIQTMADDWEGVSGTVKVLDMTGKTVTYLQNNEFHKNSLTQVEAPRVTGLYIVEITAGVKRYVGKFVVK